jgi:phage baseplate assembly protein gpV
LFEARDHPQGGGLSAAGRSEHGEELTCADREVGVSDGDVVLEAFDDVVDLDDRRAAASGSGVSGGLLSGGGAGVGQGPSSFVRGPS